jgi:hypothetical protein
MELSVPGNFWGIEYTPSDWKIEESPLPVAAEPLAGSESSAAVKPARLPRWRLTDISAGACYLETAAPFPADTAVLLSIRASNAEFLLDGVYADRMSKRGWGLSSPAHRHMIGERKRSN